MTFMSSKPSRQFLLQTILVLTSLVSGSDAVTFTLENKCRTTVWPGTLSGKGPLLINGGTQLSSGHSIKIDAPHQWSGRFWARTGCTFNRSGKGTCATGDCSGALQCGGIGGSPPVTLAEFTLDDKDFYDISVVDGFNIPISIYPSSNGTGECKKVECFTDLDRQCPKELQVVRGGETVACKSACLAFNEPRYCCTGAYGNPQTCKPTTFSRMFKDACPSYYSYAYDDASSLFTCSGASYVIRFC